MTFLHYYAIILICFDKTCTGTLIGGDVSMQTLYSFSYRHGLTISSHQSIKLQRRTDGIIISTGTLFIFYL